MNAAVPGWLRLIIKLAQTGAPDSLFALLRRWRGTGELFRPGERIIIDGVEVDTWLSHQFGLCKLSVRYRIIWRIKPGFIVQTVRFFQFGTGFYRKRGFLT